MADLLKNIPFRRKFLPPNSFTLVEVVIALGVISFGLITVIGLIGVGLQGTQESGQRLNASNLASMLVSTRRSIPVCTNGTINNFALPEISSSATFPMSAMVKVSADGTTNNAATALYNCYYNITTNVLLPKVATVDLILWWPQSTTAMPTNNPGSYYETVSEIPYN